MSDRPSYRRNKARTLLQIVTRIANWPTAVSLRLNRRVRGLRLLRFRSGLALNCRSGTRDWDVIYELLFSGGYQRALGYLATITQPHTVLDLGGNIGVFSLLAAQANPRSSIEIFEPGPPNLHVLETNCRANPELAKRITIHREGAGGAAKRATWFFDAKNPGGSSFFGTGDSSVEVQIRSFSEIVSGLAAPIALVKIDIEGGEYDIIAQTPAELWERIWAIALELHTDPSGKRSEEDFLTYMKHLGYEIEVERVCSYFLIRKPQLI